MRVHVVENNSVTNIIEVSSDANLSDFNAMDLGAFAEIGDTVTDGVSVQASERESAYNIAQKRLQRNELLSETDWWALSDRTMTQAQIDYRQALRDLPEQEGFPNVDFPTKP